MISLLVSFPDNIDIDECLLGLSECHPNARCENTLGSYYCNCTSIYVGDGYLTCQGIRIMHGFANNNDNNVDQQHFGQYYNIG